MPPPLRCVCARRCQTSVARCPRGWPARRDRCAFAGSARGMRVWRSVLLLARAAGARGRPAGGKASTGRAGIASGGPAPRPRRLGGLRRARVPSPAACRVAVCAVSPPAPPLNARTRDCVQRACMLLYGSGRRAGDRKPRQALRPPHPHRARRPLCVDINFIVILYPAAAGRLAAGTAARGAPFSWAPRLPRSGARRRGCARRCS